MYSYQVEYCNENDTRYKKVDSLDIFCAEDMMSAIYSAIEQENINNAFISASLMRRNPFASGYEVISNSVYFIKNGVMERIS